MTKKLIGTSFPDELAVHGGLIGQHFTWSPDGTIEFFDDTPQAVIDGVSEVYEAHDPTKPSWGAFKVAARTALTESDKTVMRCYENTIPLPPEWALYRKALRAIVGASAGDATQVLPTRPAYPASA